MKIDAVPGHHDELPRDAEAIGARRPTRSSAPSSAASATPSCARPRTSLTQAAVRRVGAPSRRSRGAAAGGGGGGGQAAAAATPRRSSRTARQHRRHGLRRLPHAGRRGHERARSARTSTRCSRARTRRSSSSRSCEPDAEIAKGFQQGHHAGELREYPQPARGRRARQVPVGGDASDEVGPADGRRLRARAGTAPALFIVLGVAFSYALLDRRCARPTATTRLARRRGGPRDRAARRAAVLPRRPRRVRLLVLLGGRPADAARGPLRPRRALVEGLLPGQHRSQGDRDPVHGHTRSSSCSSAA